MVTRLVDSVATPPAAAMARTAEDDWDLDIQVAQHSVHTRPRPEMTRSSDHSQQSGGFHRSATMTIALEGKQAQLSGGDRWLPDTAQGPSDGRVPLIVCGAAGGLLLLSAVLALLLWRRRAMKSRSEKIYKLRREEKDPWSESPPGKSSGCLKLCTEGIRSSGLPIYYHRTAQPASPQTPSPAAESGSLSRHHKPPPVPTSALRSHIPPPLEPSRGRSVDSQRWTDNVVYISGYSPTLERRRPVGEPAPAATTPAAAAAAVEVHDTTAAYRTLPSKQKRLQQFYATASSAEVGSCAATAGEVSPDRVDLMLLDEEMRTRSLPSWMRNKNRTKLQDASQHPLSFSHKQRNRMGNDAASVIARAKTQYPSRSSQEPTIVYDVRTAL